MVLEHGRSSAGRIRGERGKDLLGINVGSGRGGQQERLGQNLFGPIAVQGFAEYFEAATGEGGERLGNAVVTHLLSSGGEEIRVFEELDRGIAKQRGESSAQRNRKVGARRGESMANAFLGLDIDVGNDGDAGLAKGGGAARLQRVGQGDGRQSVDKQGAGVAADTKMNGVAGVVPRPR